jgi:hypothetical protein
MKVDGILISPLAHGGFIDRVRTPIAFAIGVKRLGYPNFSRFFDQDEHRVEPVGNNPFALKL